MKVKAILFLAFLWCCSTANAQLSEKKVKKLISKTWYAKMVGNEGVAEEEMLPTKRTEILEFTTDGEMSIFEDVNMENPVASGKWSYNDSDGKLKVVFSVGGAEQEVPISLRELSEESMILDLPNKSTKYTLTPPDPNAPKPCGSPMQIGSVSTVDLDEWTGLYPFTRTVTWTVDNQSTEAEAIGHCLLYVKDGKKIIKKFENGCEAIYEVSEGAMIAGERHFGIATEDPAIAGEFVFREDGTMYYYYDKDQSAVEYWNDYGKE